MLLNTGLEFTIFHALASIYEFNSNIGTFKLTFGAYLGIDAGVNSAKLK